MPAPWSRLPKPYRIPLLFLVGLLVFALTQDPAGALGLGAVVLVVLGAVAGAQRWSRRRAAGRRRSSPYGTGVWRARVEPQDVPGLTSEGFSLGWLADSSTVDVHVDGTSLRLEPTRSGRLLSRFHPVALSWQSIAAVQVVGKAYELGGKPLLVPLEEVRVVLVGDVVDEVNRPLTEDEVRDEEWSEQERREFDAENLASGREKWGEDYVFGTQPFALLLVEDAAGFAETARRYLRGRVPEGPAG